MKGDRIIVGDQYNWEPGPNKENKTMVYMPVLDEQGRHRQTPDGGTIVEAVGGVLCGSTATIQGPVINVHRTYLRDGTQQAPAMGGKDFVQMVEVFFDRYQKPGFMPVDNIRIFGGSVG